MNHFLELALRQGAEKAQTYLKETSIEEIIFQNNQLKNIITKELKGLNLQVVKNNQIGSLATSDLSRPDFIVNRVMEIVNYGDEVTYDFVGPGAFYLETELVDNKIYQANTEELVEIGEEIIKEVQKYDRNIQLQIQIHRSRAKMEICNTLGLNLASIKDNYWTLCRGILVDGDNFIDTSVQRFQQDGIIDYNKIAEKIIEKIKLARTIVQFKSDKYPVIFTPRAVSHIARAMTAFYGHNVVREISPLKNLLNRKIFDDKMTIIDDGTLKGGFKTDKFDDEGTPMQRTILVENGVLKNFVHNLHSAAQAGIFSTGNGFKYQGDYSRSAEVNFSNLIFAPGELSLDEMISDLKTGILIDSIQGLAMGNLLQGNLDTDIDMAYAIKDGKIVGRMKNGAIGTNLYKIFKENLVELGDELVHNNIGHFAVYAPYILCKDIYVTMS